MERPGERSGRARTTSTDLVNAVTVQVKSSRPVTKIPDRRVPWNRGLSAGHTNFRGALTGSDVDCQDGDNAYESHAGRALRAVLLAAGRTSVFRHGESEFVGLIA